MAGDSDPSVSEWQMFGSSPNRSGSVLENTSPNVESRPHTIYIGDQDHSVYALDAIEGELRWKFNTGGKIHSSPAVANSTLYIGSGDNRIYAIDLIEGMEEWRFEADAPVYSSPAIVNGTIYVGSHDGYLYAISAKKGNLSWKFNAGSEVLSSPAVVDGSVYVGDVNGQLYSLNADDGREEWVADINWGIHSSPSISNGVIYTTSSDGHGRHNPGGMIHAIDTDDGEIVWDANTEYNTNSTPAVQDDTVIVGTEGGDLLAIDGRSGEQKWEYEANDSMSLKTITSSPSFSSSPAIADGSVYIGNKNGKVYCIDLSTGVEQWSFDTNLHTVSSPAISGDLLFIGSGNAGGTLKEKQGYVYALDADTGEKVWQHPTDGGSWYSSPAVTAISSSSDLSNTQPKFGQDENTASDTNLYDTEGASNNLKSNCRDCGFNLEEYTSAEYCPKCGTDLK